MSSMFVVSVQNPVLDHGNAMENTGDEHDFHTNSEEVFANVVLPTNIAERDVPRHNHITVNAVVV